MLKRWREVRRLRKLREAELDSETWSLMQAAFAIRLNASYDFISKFRDRADAHAREAQRLQEQIDALTGKG